MRRLAKLTIEHIMVPYAKYRLGLNDGSLELLLLLLGAGAITMMPAYHSV
jgi:hypothetical protein